MQTIATDITIDAPTDAVWAVLTDFERYDEWNPFIIRGAGEARVGAELDLTMKVVGESRFRPTVQIVEAGRVLEWLGAAGRPGIFDGRHRFELVADGDRTRLMHTEVFSGFLHRPLLAVIGRRTRAGFEAMNRALADRVAAQLAG